MKGLKEKFNEANEVARKQLRAQQENAAGLGVKDRFRVAKGENVRWEQTRKGNGEDEDGEGGGAGATPAASTSTSSGRTLPPGPPARNLGPPPSRGASIAAGIAPPPPSRTGGSVPPPPPGAKPSLPARTGAGAGAGAPPPSLPPRMGNEAGIDNPPPPYTGAKPSGAGAPPALPGRKPGAAAAGGDHIRFSTMTQADKQAFFTLFDQYFASRGASDTA